MTDDSETAIAVLNPREQMAMREALELYSRGRTMGQRKMVSMQGCEDVGLVRRVIGPNGLIIDWTLTRAGRKWTP